MVLLMTRPWRHPDTGIFYFRGRPPAHVLPRLNGGQFSVTVGDETSTVTVRPITKISLRTNNASAAKARLASVLTQIENWWRTARSEEISLPY